MAWQFWIDRGGTFTDLVGVGPSGQTIVRKILSDQPGIPGDPAVHAIRTVLELKDQDFLTDAHIEEVRLGTTVATNALLEGNGDRVLLLTNIGFGDILRIGDQHRRNLFELNISPTPNLADYVIEVPGRINAAGEELEPMVFNSNLKLRVNNLLDEGFNSCAIALLHSYVNPKHEILLCDWLLELGFDNVVTSHQVCPLPRIVQRGQTSLVEASLSPLLKRYLDSVRIDLGQHPKLRVMGSNGGLFPPDLLFAKDTILSGPAAGMIGAVAAAHSSGFTNVPLIGFDMGGTSTDVFYASPGGNQNDWERIQQTDIAGLSLMATRLPIYTVAAGGGSIISADSQKLTVGPRSAGANPGPACYRRDGPLTITDANLLLGRIQADSFPSVFGDSGNQPLDSNIVVDRFLELSIQLKTSSESIAEGALTIALERMAEAIRKVSIHLGHDIRGGVLVAYGGAGGQHACRLADLLGLRTILMHPLSGVLSAYGMGQARQRHIQSVLIRSTLNQSLLEKLDLIAHSEKEKATLILCSSGDIKIENIDDLVCYLRLEIRDQGCEQGLVLPYTSTQGLEKIVDLFKQEYRAQFGYLPEKNDTLVVERLEIEVIAPSLLENQPSSQCSFSLPTPTSSHRRSIPKFSLVHWPSLGWKKVPLIQRNDLSIGQSIIGPALILEENGCIVLEPNWQARLNIEESLVLTTIKNPTPSSQSNLKVIDSSVDPVLLELFNHRFMSIAEQMGDQLRQTSRSINIRERLDFSCALFDNSGNLVANAPHIPVHLGSMGETIVDLLEQISRGEREPLTPGESVLSNDPFHGGTHLPDITVVTPVFNGHHNKPDFFVASRGHHSDVGGLTPGSMPPFSKTIEDEGLLLRNLVFVKNQRLQYQQFDALIAKLVIQPRNKSELIADLQAQLAANQLGLIELQRLVEKYGQLTVKNYMSYIQVNAADALRAAIKTLNPGSFAVYLDNNNKLNVDVSIDRQNSILKLDFNGTSLQGNHNFNAPYSVTKASILYVFRCLIAGDNIPLNAGCFHPIELIVPEATLLNPISPAAVVAGNVETSQALCNLLFASFGKLAASQGTMNNLTFGNRTCQYYETIAGGSGAGYKFNGADGVQTHMTNSRITDPEILELRYPVLLEKFCFRIGSGGKGRWRGGNGLERRLRFLEPMSVSILSGSRRVRPFGIKGGQPGSLGINLLHRVNGNIEILDGCTTLDIQPGEAITIKTPGGGGYGTPAGAN